MSAARSLLEQGIAVDVYDMGRRGPGEMLVKIIWTLRVLLMFLLISFVHVNSCQCLAQGGGPPHAVWITRGPLCSLTTAASSSGPQILPYRKKSSSGS